MYLSANVRLVSLRSTMRTLPKAPRPTTRSRRKWLRLAISKLLGQLGRSQEWKRKCSSRLLAVSAPLGAASDLCTTRQTRGRAKGGRDAVGRDSLGGFCRRTFACQVDGLSLAVAHDEDRGGVGGQKSAAGIVNDGERSCCSFAVCGRWQSNAWLAVLFSAVAEESAGQWGAVWSTQSRKWAD